MVHSHTDRAASSAVKTLASPLIKNPILQSIALKMSHVLGRHFEKMQITPTSHRNGCQNLPTLLHQACFTRPYTLTCTELVWKRLFFVPTRLSAIS
jgi:hypothetical protein